MESLAAPINDTAAKLAKLDAVVESRASAPLRKIEQLEKARDRRIAKIQQEYAAKIEAAKTEAEQAGAQLTPEEQEQEAFLLENYALAIIKFSEAASPAELAPILGVSTREAKKIIEQAKDSLSLAGGIPSSAPAPAPSADSTQPVTAAAAAS